MCLGQSQQQATPPAAPVPAPPPPVDAPVAPVLNDKNKDSTNASQIVAGARRGVNSLRINMNGGSNSNGLAIPT